MKILSHFTISTRSTQSTLNKYFLFEAIELLDLFGKETKEWAKCCVIYSYVTRFPAGHISLNLSVFNSGKRSESRETKTFELHCQPFP